MVAVVLALLALAGAAVALVIALKKQSVKVVKETKTVIEHAPADSPFYYDESKKTYILDGDLNVDGFVTCLGRKEG